MVYLVDLVRGETVERFVARKVRDVFPFLEKENPENSEDFLVRIQKIQETSTPALEQPINKAVGIS